MNFDPCKHTAYVVAHSGADPRWHGGPTDQRVAEIHRRYFYDQEGKFGPRGMMYLDGQRYLAPRSDK